MNLQPPGQHVERVPPDPRVIEAAFADIERELGVLGQTRPGIDLVHPADRLANAIRILAALVREYITFPELVVKADPRVEAFGPIPRESTTAQVPQVRSFRTGEGG